MKRDFCIYLCLIAMTLPKICIAAPSDLSKIKEETLPINTTKFTVRLWSRFLRSATLKEIRNGIENRRMGNSAVIITFHEVNKEEEITGIYYYNYFPNLHPNTKIYSSFFKNEPKRHLYWIVVNHSPPFKLSFFLYIFPYPFQAIGVYPDFISTPVNTWPQANIPVEEFQFDLNGYGDFLLDDILFDYDLENGELISELREKRSSGVIRILYDLNKKKWSYKPTKPTQSESVHKIDNDWRKTFKHGSLDPLSPEEMERRKREFLASQPRKELFSENELKELFTEPDYTRITDPLQLARAYDWFGKYPEALAALKSAEGMAAKFELGYFLKHGRPGVSPDMEKANRLFAEIVSAIEKMGGSPSPEDYCLAGRASSEYTPENWDEKVRWKRRAASFFQKAISEGYRPAYFYSQYYLRHSSDNDPQRLLKVLPSDNLEINAFIGALAGLNSRFKSQRNRDKNLEAVKAAIYAHSNLAQAMLGMLYLHSKTDPNAFLRRNPRKAKFWLQRAADRGDTDALQILNSDSRLKDSKRSKP